MDIPCPGNPVWRLDDVCRVVEIVNSRDAARKLDEDEKITIRIVDGNRAVKPNGIRMTAVRYCRRQLKWDRNGYPRQYPGQL
jgi:hypothetical protein